MTPLLNKDNLVVIGCIWCTRRHGTEALDTFVLTKMIVLRTVGNSFIWLCGALFGLFDSIKKMSVDEATFGSKASNWIADLLYGYQIRIFLPFQSRHETWLLGCIYFYWLEAASYAKLQCSTQGTKWLNFPNWDTALNCITALVQTKATSWDRTEVLYRDLLYSGKLPLLSSQKSTSATSTFPPELSGYLDVVNGL